MKIKNTVRKLIAAVLTAAVIMGASGSLMPALEVFADFVIDGSGFDNPEITSQSIYEWKWGKPPVDEPSDDLYSERIGGHTVYPVLITYRGRYVTQYDAKTYLPTQFYDALRDADHSWNRASVKGNPGVWISSGKKMVNHPSGWYCMERPIGIMPLMTDLPMDVNSLVTAGHAISMTIPHGIPRFISLGKDLSKKVLEAGMINHMPHEWDPEAISCYAIMLGEDYSGVPTWLMGKLRRHTVVYEDIFGFDTYHSNSLDWLLYEQSGWTVEQFVSEEMLQRDYFKQRAAFKGDPEREATWMYVGLLERAWYLEKWSEGGNTYSIGTYGINENQIWRTSGSAAYGSYINDTYNWAPKIVLAHGATSGIEDILMIHGSYPPAVYGVKSTSQFQVYYGDPMTMNFLRSDTVVQKGQVSNLVGPLCIGENVTVTVEDGGVLTVTGWVLNNGTIKVERGGTLLVQKHEETNTVLSTYPYETANDYAGTIACDGTMIIMSNCVVNAGGVYGMMFGEGAQCVNYGVLMSENLRVYTDHTIENRGGSSVVIGGYGIKDNGYSLLFNIGITNADFPNRGNYEDKQVIELPVDAVYGVGAYRTYVANRSTVERSTPANRSGKVCDIVNGTD